MATSIASILQEKENSQMDEVTIEGGSLSLVTSSSDKEETQSSLYTEEDVLGTQEQKDNNDDMGEKAHELTECADGHQQGISPKTTELEQTQDDEAELGIGFTSEIDYTHENEQVSILESSTVDIDMVKMDQESESQRTENLSLTVVAPNKGVKVDECEETTTEVSFDLQVKREKPINEFSSGNISSLESDTELVTRSNDETIEVSASTVTQESTTETVSGVNETETNDDLDVDDGDDEEAEDEEEAEEEDEEEEDDDDDDEDDNDDEESQIDFSKIMALAKKMDSKGSGNDDDWLSKLAKKISKPGEGESQVTQDTTVHVETESTDDSKRDVFGDKDWDDCQDLEVDEAYQTKFTSDREFDLSSETSSFSKTKYASAAEFDMSSEVATSDTAASDTATSDTASSKEGKFALNEYDIISHSSSIVSFSEDSSTKESTPVKQEATQTAATATETSAAIHLAADRLEGLATTPVLVRRMFTSSSQRLNESRTQVNVTLDKTRTTSTTTLKKELSHSTTSIDSNASTSTITRETPVPTVMISPEEEEEEGEGSLRETSLASSSSVASENLSTLQFTHVTQSRVLYRGKSPSMSRFSESSTDTEDGAAAQAGGAAAKESVTAARESGASLIETGVTQHLAPFAASTPSKVTPDDGIESTATGSASSSVLDSQIESTDGHETSVAQSDSETSSNSGGDVEEGWVTETL